MVNKENPEAEEPCRCRPNLQCYHINCEFCEKLPTCDPGSGLEDDPGEIFFNKEHKEISFRHKWQPVRFPPGSTNGRKICAPCRAGFFSADRNSEQCKEWTEWVHAETCTETFLAKTASICCGGKMHQPEWVRCSPLPLESWLDHCRPHR